MFPILFYAGPFLFISHFVSIKARHFVILSLCRFPLGYAEFNFRPSPGWRLEKRHSDGVRFSC
jgi:hypothetical protein